MLEGLSISLCVSLKDEKNQFIGHLVSAAWISRDRAQETAKSRFTSKSLATIRDQPLRSERPERHRLLHLDRNRWSLRNISRRIDSFEGKDKIFLLKNKRVDILILDCGRS